MVKKGYFGNWGGAFIPEVLHQTFTELEEYFKAAQADPNFWQEYVDLMSTYSCRPTPLTHAENLSKHFGVPRFILSERTSITPAPTRQTTLWARGFWSNVWEKHE